MQVKTYWRSAIVLKCWPGLTIIEWACAGQHVCLYGHVLEFTVVHNLIVKVNSDSSQLIFIAQTVDKVREFSYPCFASLTFQSQYNRLSL